MTPETKAWLCGGSALALYLVGGIGTFAGLAMIVFFKGDDLFGWGEASSLGYLCLCVGLALSVLGVLLMRILRNRRHA